MLLLIGLCAFGTVALAAWELLRPKSAAIAARVLPVDPGTTMREQRTQGRFSQRVIAPVAARFGRRLAALLPHSWIRAINKKLVMANEPWSLGGFLTTWALSIALGVAFYLWVVLSAGSLTPLQMFAFGIAFLPFPVLIPYAVLRRRVKNRTTKITRGLADALDLLTTCVEAGMGVDAAFALVTERTEGPLSETFSAYLRQVGLGRSRRDALTYVADRTGVEDLIQLAAAINQGEELGTTLGDVLRHQAKELRAIRKQRAQEAAQRAPVLMTIPLALCFLPAMGAVVVVPSILNLINFIQDLGG